MKSRIHNWTSGPYARTFLAALIFLVVSLLTAIPVFAGAVGEFSQCKNGTAGTQPPVCPGGANNWINGNLNPTNSQYQPGQVVPQRMSMLLSTGTTYSISLSFQAGSGIVAGNQGTHAYDYFATYSETVTTAQPCDGITGCTQSSPTSTFAIPIDPSNKAACGFTATQHPGWFTVWNGNISAVSSYIYNSAKDLTGSNELNGSGCLITNTNTFVGLVFTFTVTSNTNPMVLAWGTHISYDQEWGPNNAAPSISGASYHMILANCGAGITGCGNKDNQLQLNATPTAVRLSKFGVLEVVPARVTLGWDTASEVNTAGFNVYRAERLDQPFVRVNAQLIPASSASITGGKYEFQDKAVTPGKTYYYQLEDVETNGESTRHSPVSITVSPEQSALTGNWTSMLALGVGAIAVIGSGLFLTLKRLSVI